MEERNDELKRNVVLDLCFVFSSVNFISDVQLLSHELHFVSCHFILSDDIVINSCTNLSCTN